MLAAASRLSGVPTEVAFCKSCVVSNQRPQTTVEFNNKNNKQTIFFDEQGVCSACQYHVMKQQEIDWQQRHEALLATLDKHRSKDGAYDVVVPGSGGKDSMYVAHILKEKYGMHPLSVTWPPHMYTDIGRENFAAWVNMGIDNLTLHPSQEVHRRLTQLAFTNLLHPFQGFVLGQKQIGPKIAAKFGIKLVMYGESQAEGGSQLEEAFSATMPIKYFSKPRSMTEEVIIGGLNSQQLAELGMSRADLQWYRPIASEDVQAQGIEVHHMGYYEHWRPQEKYYYAVENCGFQPNPERSEGTYSKYASLDDKMDGFHYYTTFIKFGIGRATYDAAQEIRNRHITREEGVALVHRYDGEFPKKYFNEVLDYLAIDETRFHETIDKFRPQHLWHKTDGDWQLKYQVE